MKSKFMTLLQNLGNYCICLFFNEMFYNIKERVCEAAQGLGSQFTSSRSWRGSEKAVTDSKVIRPLSSWSCVD